ncbi:MAG: hypothetical protein AB1491_00215 [Thermodesulfobacteriota bacterium]
MASHWKERQEKLQEGLAEIESEIATRDAAMDILRKLVEVLRLSQDKDLKEALQVHVNNIANVLADHHESLLAARKDLERQMLNLETTPDPKL